MTFTAMITTRDRVQDLEATCARLRQLKPAPDEVLICADGCRDDTASMLRTKFPEFTVLLNERPRGSVYSRDRMLRVARGQIVLSLDDDSYPPDPDFLERLSAVFAAHPEAAVVVLSQVQTPNMHAPKKSSGPPTGQYLSAYANCAAAMRRQIYSEVPGYPVLFEHMYEEPDYAQQCYAAGAAVWFEPSLTVVHRESSANRDWLRRHQQNARNELWSVWLRCPWPWLPLVSLYRIARQFLYACSNGARWMLREPQWWIAAARGTPACWRKRDPIPWPIYYRWMRLPRKPVYSLQQLRAQFPMKVGRDRWARRSPTR